MQKNDQQSKNKSFIVEPTKCHAHKQKPIWICIQKAGN